MITITPLRRSRIIFFKCHYFRHIFKSGTDNGLRVYSVCGHFGKISNVIEKIEEKNISSVAFTLYFTEVQRGPRFRRVNE